MDSRIDGARVLALGERVLRLEAESVLALLPRLGDQFVEAVALLQRCRGRVIVTAMGKSGIIGRKIASTLASTGTPAYFLHPAEGVHGDLGMVAREDVMLALSNSGETEEVLAVLPAIKRLGIPLLLLTGDPASTLARQADVVLNVGVAEEACPMNLAPTSSTTAALAMGDALAMALLDSKGFTARDFKMLHPGGQLGARLKFVSDLMHKNDRLPLAAADQVMAEAIVVMTEKALGCLGVVDENGYLKGIITDGDLRRHMGDGLLAKRAQEIMTPAPKTVSPDLLASAALELINATRITALFVVENGRPVGIIHVHDLLRAGVA